MADFSTPVEFSFILSTIGVIFAVIGVCIFLVNQKTKKLKERH